MFTRTLGRSDVEVSAMGLGCWAIGGKWYGRVDDDESIRALHCALDMGVNYLDTAEGYGENGHSESVIGKALQGRRDKVFISTKFGGQRTELDDIRGACEASLKRLRTDYIDLYQCRGGPVHVEHRDEIRQVLEKLVEEGKIHWYGCSTDNAESIRILAQGPHCTAAQTALNVLRRNPEALAACKELNLASINRSPLAMGILSGKFTADTTFAKDDVRGAEFPWLQVYFDGGKPRSDLLEKLEAIRDILTSQGRTLVQGALAWIWGRSERTIPIPGFKTVAQIEENVAAMDFGPLTPEQMVEIDVVLER